MKKRVDMMDLDYTDAVFDAAHKGEYADEFHGHTWNVRVFWMAIDRIDARLINAKLKDVLSEWDHKTLDGKVDPTNYGVALAVLEKINEIVKVKVWRGGVVPCGAEALRKINDTE